MTKREIKISSEFKGQTTKAILSLSLFIFAYLLMLIIATGLTALSIYGGIMLIAVKPMFITLALGAGLSSLGFLVLIFLLKFIFKSNKTDRSHLIQITENDEPELFSLIQDIVKHVDTNFPKKVYLSTDVNAGVFYDSNFWSMLLPIKKNLQIGLGLVNSVSKTELKAILSHEFGHFSQKTMKVGSYVYNVNQVIYNLLYDNESFDRLVQSWANISGYFSIFVFLAVKIIEGIQSFLRMIYGIVNKNYMGLSREMEFHADEIAASITGYEPLKNSLLRMSLADHSFNYVLSFYEEKIKLNKISENIYKEHSFVMNFLAKDNDYKIENNLPKIPKSELNKFNKSKLVIKDQWASHPSTEERIENLEKTGMSLQKIEFVPATEIFKNIDKTQIELTNKMFENIQYQDDPTCLPFEQFQKEYLTEFSENSFSKIYNNYYDNKNPAYFEIDEIYKPEELVKKDELFTNKMTDFVYTSIALQNDIETIKQIADKLIPVKTFDYDGKKYKRKDCKELIKKLEKELNAINDQIKKNDIKIFLFFSQCEQENKGTSLLEKFYKNFFDYDKEFDSKNEVYIKLSNEIQFINFTTPINQIHKNLLKIQTIELELKSGIKELLVDSKYESEITEEIRDNFELYISKNWEYFSSEKYLDNNLEILFTAMSNYAFLLSRGYFLLKKELLDYQVNLLKTTHEKAYTV